MGLCFYAAMPDFRDSLETSDIKKCVQVLETLLQDGSVFSQLPTDLRESLMSAAGRLSRPAKDELRIRNKLIDRARRERAGKLDRQTRKSTGIREARQEAVFVAPARIEGTQALSAGPDERILHKSRNCYVCKAEYNQLHFFYDSMCASCAEFNYQKRFQTARLDGRVALITGARLKIGYHAALLMLRAGARVIVTTRFPRDAAARYSKEKDFSQWQDRLEIHGLDLRHTPSVELFAKFIEQRAGRLDILINNAAQTVRRPPGFYAHLIESENRDFNDLPAAEQQLLRSHEDCKSVLRQAGLTSVDAADANKIEAMVAGVEGAAQAPQNTVSWHGQGPGIGLRSSAQLSQIPYSFDNALATEEIFPVGRLDADLQQVDLRSINSWRLGLADVSTPEMLEVQLVNSVAPFVLCSRLTPLMRKDPTGEKHIVNVSAMEGKFTRFTKTDKHPHTNMAKAALNMMTLTSARDLIKDGIHMNAVDTGWVTDEDPAQLSLRKQQDHDFQPPLDIVDGAARICDPFFNGLITGQHVHGFFLKDYFPTEW